MPPKTEVNNEGRFSVPSTARRDKEAKEAINRGVFGSELVGGFGGVLAGLVIGAVVAAASPIALPVALIAGAAAGTLLGVASGYIDRQRHVGKESLRYQRDRNELGVRELEAEKGQYHNLEVDGLGPEKPVIAVNASPTRTPPVNHQPHMEQYRR